MGMQTLSRLPISENQQSQQDHSEAAVLSLIHSVQLEQLPLEATDVMEATDVAKATKSNAILA